MVLWIFSEGGLYLFTHKVFFCGGKMFLKKRQNLLTIGNILLKSNYRDEKIHMFMIEKRRKKLCLN